MKTKRKQGRVLAVAAACVALSALTACGSGKDAGPATLDVVRISAVSDDFGRAVRVVDWPQDGPEQTVDSIRAWIAGQVPMAAGVWRAAGVEAALYHAADSISRELKEYSYGMCMAFDSMTIALGEQTGKYVNMCYGYQVFYCGAHGVEGTFATTFRKPDGLRMNAQNMFVIASSSELHALYRLIQSHLDVPSVQVDKLPDHAPYFTGEGVVFVYAEYEIASYAMGTPAAVVPYDELVPWLTSEARLLAGVEPD